MASGAAWRGVVRPGLRVKNMKGETMEIHELTKRQIDAVVAGRLTLRKLYDQKGWVKPKWLP